MLFISQLAIQGKYQAQQRMLQHQVNHLADLVDLVALDFHLDSKASVDRTPLPQVNRLTKELVVLVMEVDMVVVSLDQQPMQEHQVSHSIRVLEVMEVVKE